MKRIEQYGAFIDLGEVDGLLYYKDMSIHTVEHPSDIVKVNEILNLRVKTISDENEKKNINLTMIGANDSEKLCFTEVYDCRIIKTDAGKIHVATKGDNFGIVEKSELSYQNIDNISSYYFSGERIKAKFIDSKFGKNYFSIKDAYDDSFFDYTNGIYLIGKFLRGRVVFLDENKVLIKLADYNVIAIYKPKELDIISRLLMNDTVICEIKEIKDKEVFININFDIVFKDNLECQLTELDKQINNEIGFCYEHFAFRSGNKNKRNYLQWAQHFYSLGYSPRSYFIRALIEFEEIINLMSEENDIENVIKSARIQIQEIDDSDIAVQVFPILKTVRSILEILSSFNDYKQMPILFNYINSTNMESEVVKLAKLVSSYNLYSSEINNDGAFKQKIWKKIYSLDVML